MNLKIKQEIQKSQEVNFPSLAVIFDLMPRQTVQQVLAETDAEEDRRRKLPSEWVVWIVIVMNWLPRYSMSAVMAKALLVISLGFTNPTERMASASAISQARYRVGVKPFEQLFKQMCRPMASETTIGAFYQGKRLVAFDGTRENVADTPLNAAYFGRTKSQHGESAFPQLRAVYACELGTHIIFDAVFGACYRGEHPLACRLLRSITPDMLVLFDAGLSSFDLISGVLARGADVLARSHASRKWKPVEYLSDGSFLAWMTPSDKSQDPHATPILVRVIRFRLDDENRVRHGKTQTLVTTLLDPLLYPTRELITLYHERWDVEIAIDEMDSHQRLAHRPFRSLKPVGVIQEFYGFLIAYFLIRLVMLRTADHAQLDPDALSFTNSIHLILDAMPLFQLFHETDHQSLWLWLKHWIAYFKLPPRRDRSNPRVIKRQRFKFPRKSARHLNPPQPTKSFSEAILMLT